MLNLNRISNVIGMTGSGKSYFVKKNLMPKLLASGKKILIVDNLTLEWGFLGLKTFKSINELKANVEYIRNNHSRISLKNYDVKDLSFIIEFARLIGNIYLLWEEAGADFGKFQDENILRFSMSGRHKNVAGLFITQKPRLLPTPIISQAYDFFIFAVEDNYDIIEIKKRFYKYRDVIDEELDNLPQHCFLWLQKGTIKGVFRAQEIED